MADNKLIDIKGLEVVYEDILTTLKDNYVKNSDVQESKTVTPDIAPQTVKADTGKSLLKQVVVDAIPNQKNKVVDSFNTISTTAAQTITIPAGYYTEDSTVTLPKQDAVTITGVSSGNKVTPSTSAQTITVSAGWNASEDKITVASIPSKYKDTTGANAVQADVLNGKKFVNTSGLQTGNMPNIGKQTISLSTTSRSVAISKGYHDGTGTATVPSDYYPVNSTNTTATDSDILQGKKVVGTDGNTITGNIATVTPTKTQPTATATAGTTSITKQPSATAEVTYSGIKASTTNTGYSVTARASAASGVIEATGGSASTTAGSLSVNKGYVASNTSVSVEAKSASGTKATSTEKTASDSKTIYIQKGSAATPATSITANPTVTLSGSNIVASYSGSKSITPTVTEGYVTAGTAGTVSTSGSTTTALSSLDSDFKASNIKDGVTVLGVTGTFTETSNGAAAVNIIKDKEAWVNGTKVTGTMANNGAVNKTLDSATTSYTVPAGYHNGSGKVSISVASLAAVKNAVNGSGQTTN